MRLSLARPLRTRLGAAVVVLALALAAIAPALLRAADSQDGQRTDLKVLLMTTNSGTDMTDPDGIYATWRDVLDMEGIPHDTFDSSKDDLTADFLSEGNHAKYQAIIVTSGNMTEPAYNQMTQTESDILYEYERDFGIRQITDNLWPSAPHGLVSPTNPLASGERDGTVATLTPAGKALFPELKGAIPVPDEAPGVPETYGTLATAGSDFQILAEQPGLEQGTTAPFLGIYTHPTIGTEEMVMLVTSNPYQSHNQLLRRGMLRWVTHGVHLGAGRNYFSAHIDDVFLPTTIWNTTLKCTPGNDDPNTCPETSIGENGETINHVNNEKMAPSDTQAAIAAQNKYGIKFDMAFNGYGYRRDDQGDLVATDALGDDPNYGLLKPAIRDQFRWINHTWSHEQFDPLPLRAPNQDPFMGLVEQIHQNIEFATDPNFQETGNHPLPIDPKELVTGEHSGLGSYAAVGGQPKNQFIEDALSYSSQENVNNPNDDINIGITWIADDASVQNEQRQIGSATTVPRHPSNIYYNVSSRTDQLDEYNWIYSTPAAGGNCQNSPTTTCRTTPATWDDYTASESRIMFGHITGNDPRPHFMHQPNLMVDANGNGIMYGADDNGVLDVLFDEYQSLFNTTVAPVIDPSMTEAGIAIRQQTAWQTAKNDVTAYIQNGKVTIETSGGAVDVPITGTTVGSVWGDARSGWTSVDGSVTLDVAPLTAPAVTGTPVLGQTLTATSAKWSNGVTGPAGVWVRCDEAGANCAPIAGATGTTYTVTSADLGSKIHYSETAVWTRGVAKSSVQTVPNVVAPVITAGNAWPGQGITLSSYANWGTPGVPQSGQWSVCPTATSTTDCVLTGATGLTYAIANGDVGKFVRYQETEQVTTPADQRVTSYSNAIAVVAAPVDPTPVDPTPVDPTPTDPGTGGGTTPPTGGASTPPALPTGGGGTPAPPAGGNNPAPKPPVPTNQCPTRPQFNSIIYKDGVTSFYYRPRVGQDILGARRLGNARLRVLLNTPKGRSTLPRLEYTTAKPVDAKRLPWFARKVGPNRVVTAIMANASSKAYSGVRLAYQPKKGTYAKLILPKGTVKTTAPKCPKVTGYATIYAQNIFVDRRSK